VLGTQLRGKCALITGGGKGIGRGIVERFAAEGAQVAVAQRSPLPTDLGQLPGVHGIQADLTDPAGFAEIADRAAELMGGIDVLVNNAGAMAEQSVEEITVEEWDRMVSLNLRAPLFMTQAVLPHLRARGGGSVISVGSIEGIAANPGHSAYSASKAGVHGLSRAMAVDLGAEGIRCNTIVPGWISTELSEDYLASMPDPEAAREELHRLHPVGRLGTATDIGDLAVFLAGDGSSFITGEMIVVDGGRTARLPGPTTSRE
jgi:meso-butanediol dehydrogenase/(S,S)-butanediol dehydrogenase/diacetyl reductase